MGALINGYGFGAAAAILGISESRLRYWSQSGFVGPSGLKEGKQVYSFQDLASVKAAKELVDRGFTPADIRRALDRVRTALPDIDRPLEHLRLAWNGEELVLVEDQAAFALTGQRVFDFGLGELRARASGWGQTTPVPADATVEIPAAAPAASAYGCFQEGLAREAEGAIAEAQMCYRRALKHDPGLAAAHTNLGQLAHRRGDAAGARAAFEAALALDPEQPEARYNLASMLLESGELELGAAELRRVIQLRPDFADAHFNLATVLEALGGRRQAREHLAAYLGLSAKPSEGADPWITDAEERIARLG